MGRRVLITGVSGFWGTELARRLERVPEVEYIAGLDVRPPAADLARTEFIRADIRNPLISKLLPQTEVDTVVHCDVLLVPEPGKAPEQLHDINVIGSLQLLAACEKTRDGAHDRRPRLRRDLWSRAERPEFFTEDMARRFPLRTRFQRDIGELENYFENFARRFPEVTVMMLRYQPTLGTAIDSPLTRYLQQPVVPTQLGYDPLLQFVHAEDAVGALEAAVRAAGARAGERGGRGQRLAQPPAAARRASVPLPGPGAAVRRRARRGRAARPRAPASGGGAVAAQRPHDRLHAPDRGGRLPPALDGRGRRGLRRGAARPPRPARIATGAERAEARPHDASTATTRSASAPAGCVSTSERSAGPAAVAPSARRGRRPSRGDAEAARAALDFLALLREATRQGSDLPARVERAAGTLPGSARDIARRAARRLRGEYAQDEWGFDEEFVEIVYPLFELMYERWWRVDGDRRRERARRTTARCSSPTTPACCPWDATMMSVAILKHHPLPRHPRFMVLDWAFRLPWVSAFMRRIGGVVASPYNAMRLLEQGHLVMVFPEGSKGAGKPFSERYRLQRFGRGGFVELALRTGAPIVPVAVVGLRGDLSEARRVAAAGAAHRRSLLPAHADVPVARALRAPMPLPSKWRIEFCEPIDLSALRSRGGGGPRAGVRAVRARARDDPGGRATRTCVARGSAFL